MRNAVLFVIAFVSTANYAGGRVYYLNNLDGARGNDAIYPIVERQASRDLDLAFSAGDPLENVVTSPTRKVSKPSQRVLERERETESYLSSKIS